MATLRKPWTAIAGLALLGSLVGCDAEQESAPVELETQVDQLITYDLVSQRKWVGEGAHTVDPELLADCEIRPYGLPSNARIEGALLRWSPEWAQVGPHVIYLDYSAGCDDFLPTWLDTYRIEVRPLAMFYSDEVMSEGVHDLEDEPL